jgi:hypothetical protein
MKLPQSTRALRLLSSVLTLAGLAVLPTSLHAALGEVSVSGSTWTGKVDGATKYTGSSMAAAVNACSGTNLAMWVRVYNGGNANGQMRIFTNQSVDGWGNNITGAGSQGILYSQNSNAVGGKNINMRGNAWFGMYFRTCNGNWFSGVNGQSNLGYRIDNCKGGEGYDLQMGSSNVYGGGSHAYETYGITGIGFGTLTCTDMTGGCGVLLNDSANASGTTVNSTRCNLGGGYAGFRTANNNLSTSLGTVNANNCGRGFFSVSGSGGATLNRVFASNCSSHGVWLQSTRNSRVNGGTVTACNPCSSISQDLGGNTVVVTCR